MDGWDTHLHSLYGTVNLFKFLSFPQKSATTIPSISTMPLYPSHGAFCFERDQPQGRESSAFKQSVFHHRLTKVDHSQGEK
eukprot:4462697-Ditylum_brightwellii.AAC.1